MKSHPRRFAQFFVWWKDGSWEAAATYNGALDTAPTARVTGLGTANVKAERRHTASALPECLEESAELALRALERVLPRANRLRGSSCAHWHTRHSAHCACDRVGDREREGGAATHRVSSARVFGGERRAGPARSRARVTPCESTATHELRKLAH